MHLFKYHSKQKVSLNTNTMSNEKIKNKNQNQGIFLWSTAGTSGSIAMKLFIYCRKTLLGDQH